MSFIMGFDRATVCVRRLMVDDMAGPSWSPQPRMGRENRAMAKHTIPALDGVRGFAAAIVLYGHTAGAMGVSWLTPSIVAAKSGVYLFFVLSAFLLTRQFLTANLTKQTTVPFISEYLFRRCARILPLYYIAILAHYAVRFVIPGKSCVIHDASAVFKSMLLNRGYGHFWTIPIEFIFYFILPGVALLGVGLTAKWKALLAYLVFVVLSVTLFDEQHDYGVAACAYIFVCGSALAIVHVHFAASLGPWARHGAALVGLAAAAAFVTVWPVLQPRGYHYAVVEDMRALWTLCSCGLLAGCLWGAGWFRRLFDNRVIRFLGAISFSVYVWHMLVYAAVDNLARGATGEFRHVAAWLAALVIGWASYVAIEMPLYHAGFLRGLWTRAVDRWISIAPTASHAEPR